MVLDVHGGPWGRDGWRYDRNVQWLANRNYAVLQVNYRGSTGFGKTFTNAGDREWGGKMNDDLIDAVNWSVAEGIADPKRIAICGASYGGYAAFVGATFNRRQRASRSHRHRAGAGTAHSRSKQERRFADTGTAKLIA
jgi:dipeptidyl aminopeptidase/acylaminoacyl peptidase